MCGATNWFIRWPFLVEGVLLGLFGGVLAYLAQWGIYGLIGKAMQESGILSIITMIPYANMASTVLLVFLAVGFVIGIIVAIFYDRRLRDRGGLVFTIVRLF